MGPAMPTLTIAEYKKLVVSYKGRFREAAVRGLHSAAARGVQVLQTELVPSRVPQPVDRGLFRAGWRFFPDPDGAWITNVEPHAAHVEYGVRAENVKPGRKMIAALAEWAARKGLAEKGEEAVSAAWAIAKAMRRRGIFGKGMHLLDELMQDRMPDIVKEEIEAEINREKARR